MFVDVFTAWCGPCKEYGQIIEEKIPPLLTKYPQIAFVKLEVKDEATIKWVNQYQVTAVPTTLLFIDGKQAPLTYRKGKKTVTELSMTGIYPPIDQLVEAVATAN